MSWHAGIADEIRAEFARLTLWHFEDGWHAFVPAETTCTLVHGRKVSEWEGEAPVSSSGIRKRRARGMSDREAVTADRCPPKGIERRRWIEARRAEGRAA